MKYGKYTAYMCQEGTDIDKLAESRLNFKIFVAKYSKPFFFCNALIVYIYITNIEPF